MTKKSTFTIPADESDAGRVAVFLNADDARWLSTHCECNETASDNERERCGRIRFRSSTALHKSTQAIDCPAECHFVASISLLAEQSGGRKSAIHTGYRAQVFLDGDDCDATLTIDGESLSLGTSGIVFGSFANPDRNFGKLSVGKPLLLREGTRTIAYGIIVWYVEQRTNGSNGSAGRAVSEFNVGSPRPG